MLHDQIDFHVALRHAELESFDRDIEPYFIAPAKAICESLLARVHGYRFAIDRVFLNSRFKCHIGQTYGSRPEQGAQRVLDAVR